MHYLRLIYYWASEGCPDAVPAGIIAIDLGQNEADFNDPEERREIEVLCSDCGLFDDSCWQVGATQEDVDLLVKINDAGHGVYLTNSQIVPDWQWELVKQRPGVKISEHNLAEALAELDAFMDDEEGDCEEQEA